MKRSQVIAYLLVGTVLFSGENALLCVQANMHLQDKAKGKVTSQKQMKDGSPSWSPDGTKIAFYSERNGQGDIYLMNADGTGEKQLTNTSADEGYPTWSPDGKELLFDTNQDGNYEIYLMNIDGTNIRRLTNHPGNDVSATFSPDGKTIAFMSNRVLDRTMQIFLMDADGSRQRRFSHGGTFWFPQYSPDGSTIICHVHRDVHLLPVEGKEKKRLTTDPQNGMYPSWTPDGKEVVFMSWRSGETRIYKMNVDGSEQKEIPIPLKGELIDPRVSPDGKSILFVHVPLGMNKEGKAMGEDKKGAKVIYRCDLNGENLKKLSK
ncbi:MAG: hypothetical protein MPJ24_00690 [Pirellulaceae bacterium]|nr:hypothetical protein [Pirellulaceae bacterium]